MLFDHVWCSRVVVDEVEGVEYHLDRGIILLPKVNMALEPNDARKSHPG
jgi:hypothetical protein